MRLKERILAVVLIGVLSSWASAEVLYNVTQIGDAGTIAYGLNDLGQVVGQGRDANGVLQAFVWQGGAMTYLGNVPGDYGRTEAHGINNSGQVVGYSHWANGDRAFIWNGGPLSDLSGLPSSPETYATAINESGAVTASVEYGRAYVWRSGAATEIVPFPGANFPGLGQRISATGINNSGASVGWVYVGYMSHAFLWNGSEMADLGAGIARGINDAGQVVGDSGRTGQWHASLWNDGVFQNLGALPTHSYYSVAAGINSSGQVVGFSSTTNYANDGHAVIWRNGVISDLNSLIDPAFGILQEAYAINDIGQIIARTSSGGVVSSFLLTPVPEPGTLGILAIGAFASFRRRRI